MTAPRKPSEHHIPLRVSDDTYLIRQLESDGPFSIYLNSLVIAGEQPVIVDTGCLNNRDDWMNDVFSIVDPVDVRWIYLSHDDHDHVGNLEPVLDACPNATLVTSHFMSLRLSSDYALPLTRMRWLNDGELLDVGDRTLVAMRPPLYDSPTTRGLFDVRTGVYWAADCFASLVTHPADEVGDLDRTAWAESFAMTNVMNAPWYPLSDEERYRRSVLRVQSLDVRAITSAHAPLIAGAHVGTAFDMIHTLPREIVPDLGQPVLDELVARVTALDEEAA